MYKRMCKDCPRKQKSSTKYEYYCQGKGIFFSGEKNYCYTKRKISRGEKNEQNKHKYKL